MSESVSMPSPGTSTSTAEASTITQPVVSEFTTNETTETLVPPHPTGTAFTSMETTMASSPSLPMTETSTPNTITVSVHTTTETSNTSSSESPIRTSVTQPAVSEFTTNETTVTLVPPHPTGTEFTGTETTMASSPSLPMTETSTHNAITSSVYTPMETSNSETTSATSSPPPRLTSSSAYSTFLTSVSHTTLSETTSSEKTLATTVSAPGSSSPVANTTGARTTRAGSTTPVPVQCQNNGTLQGSQCFCHPAFTGQSCDVLRNNITIDDVVAVIHISVEVVNAVFNLSLENQSSPDFKAFETRFKNQTEKIYSEIPQYRGLKIISLRNGSIIVDNKIFLAVPYSSYNNTYTEAVSNVSDRLIHSNCTSNDTDKLCFKAGATQVNSVNLNIAAVCQNDSVIPAAYQKYYFPLNVSNTLMCVSNCSSQSPYGPFCKAGEQCYLGAQGPQCREPTTTVAGTQSTPTAAEFTASETALSTAIQPSAETPSSATAPVPNTSASPTERSAHTSSSETSTGESLTTASQSPLTASSSESPIRTTVTQPAVSEFTTNETTVTLVHPHATAPS
nr:mucin-3B-like [Chelonoidis abingdonii]